MQRGVGDFSTTLPRSLNEDLGWLGQTESGQIVGLLANVPQLFWVHGRTVLACSCSTYAVDSSYRLLGLTLARAFLRQRKPALLMNTTANAAAREIFGHFGVGELPAWDEVFYWVLRPVSLAASRLHQMRGAALPTALVRSLSRTPLVRSLKFKRGWPTPPEGVVIEPVTRIDDGFDGLWERLREE